MGVSQLVGRSPYELSKGRGAVRGRELLKTLLQPKAKKNPAPPLSQCQVFFVSALSKCLPNGKVSLKCFFSYFYGE